MEIAALQAFVEVADRGSFSEAAEMLYLTQPAISKRVANLESELDTRLFDRIGRKVSLTPAGTALLVPARRLINDARELKRLVSDLAGEVRGRLVMGTSHHIGLHRLPQPLKRFTASWPDVELDIRFMDSEAACRGVETGDLELAIVTLPPKAPAHLHLETIWDDPLAVMVGTDHPLASAGAIDLQQLLTYEAVLPGPTTYTRAILEEAVSENRFALRVAMATNYLETLQMLVAAGIGWSLLPATQLDDSVCAVEVEGLRPSRQLGAVTHQKRSLSNAGNEMIRMCRESVNAD
jgi:DNA-binding transcriptional LysR family regulator